MPYNASQHEKDILEFWDNDKTFEKSVNERSVDQPYVFYDGPPFATGLPHYGHIVGSVMKDVVPRYWTMQGKRVERVWGWDCHGLPIENIVEKEFGSKSKKDIEDMGVDVFNERCRSKVLSYVGEWEKTIRRLGRWVDMKHAYRTMDIGYMESIWWVFKQLWEKDLIYKGYKPMHVCPRCETTLSQQEVSEGYKDVKDLSVTAQFQLKNKNLPDRQAGEKLNVEGDVYMLAWTTTPWTLPGNTLLAVGSELDYVLVKHEDAHYIVAKELVEKNFDGKEFEIIQELKGSELVGLSYEPLFPYFAQEGQKAFYVVTGEFVTTEDGTGIVHIAPAFGADDYALYQQEFGVPFIQHVGMDGRFVDAATDFAGMHVKPADNHMATDIEIVKYLAHNGKLFAKKKYEHSYPHCWRCDTPLINYATSSWFVAVTKVKDQALAEAKNINWSPAHIKEGRFGKWLEGARDWSISRQRFWASVMPVWECDVAKKNVPGATAACTNQYHVVGSVAELEELSGQQVTDLHKHIVDNITFPCPCCGSTMRRIPDVLDTWFDSGSMPYAQVHYPFENEEKFTNGFPAEFIAEGQDQTRAWFYYLHILATALKGSPAYKNVIVNGIVLAEDGKKMSKKLQNYPDPNELLEKYGADALRYYLMSSPVVAAENLNFAEEGVREVFNKVVNTTANVLAFYLPFAKEQGIVVDEHINKTMQELVSQGKTTVLDNWILAKLQVLVEDVTHNMNEYKLHDAARPIMEFILELSQWYVRRCRDRFKDSNDDTATVGVTTLGYVLHTLSKVMAPFTPFMAEKIYQDVTKNTASVHLTAWPQVTKTMQKSEVLELMTKVRKVVEMGLSLRKEEKLKVRQPLATFTVDEQIFGEQFSADIATIIAAELNVKTVEVGKDAGVVKEDQEYRVWLDTALTVELQKEGRLRELIRGINGLRKKQGLSREDKITIIYQTQSAVLQDVITQYAEELKTKVLATDILSGEGEQELLIEGESFFITLK